MVGLFFKKYIDMAKEEIIKEERYFMIFDNFKVKEDELQKFNSTIKPEEAVLLLIHAALKAGKEGCYTNSETEVLQTCLNVLMKNEKVKEDSNQTQSNDVL